MVICFSNVILFSVKDWRYISQCNFRGIQNYISKWYLCRFFSLLSKQQKVAYIKNRKTKKIFYDCKLDYLSFLWFLSNYSLEYTVRSMKTYSVGLLLNTIIGWAFNVLVTDQSKHNKKIKYLILKKGAQLALYGLKYYNWGSN